MQLKKKMMLFFIALLLVPLILVGGMLMVMGALVGFHPADLALITEAEGISLSYKGLLWGLLATSVFGLAISALILGSWLQFHLVSPVQKLRRAAREICDGNLDYELKPRGDDEITQLGKDFEEMRLRLKESAQERLQSEQENKILISNISHDLKTPLTAIKGYVEGILDGVASSPEKMDKYLHTIYTKAEEMDRLVNELNLYAQIESSRIPYHFTKISMREYLADCVSERGRDLESHGIELSLQDQLAEDVRVIGDPEQLRRVIGNIVSNSVKYMDKPQGRLTLRLREIGDFVRLDIEDNGCGIAQRDLPYIFDRFYRTDASRNSHTGGSGIGLSIVKKIIEDHGGRIWATSREGLGTTMSIELRKYEEPHRE